MKNGHFCTSRSQSSRVYCTHKNCRFSNSGSGYPGYKSSHISATERAIHFHNDVKSIVFMKSSANSKKDFPTYARFSHTRSHISVYALKCMCIPTFIYILIIRYGLWLFIVILQELQCCLHIGIIRVIGIYHFTKFRLSTPGF